MPINPKLRDALKCMKEAQVARDARDFAKARDLCEKSIALFSTPEAAKLLESINVLDSQPKATRSEPNAVEKSRQSPNPRIAPIENRPHDAFSIIANPPNQFNAMIPSPSEWDAHSDDSGEEPETRTTPTHADTINRVLRCVETSYYEILGVTDDSTPIEIEIAYRKLIQQVDPKENQATGASRAYSLVSRAYQVLSDSKKRGAYDCNNGLGGSAGVISGTSNGVWESTTTRSIRGPTIADAIKEQRAQQALEEQMIANAVQEQKAIQEQILAQALEEQRIQRALEEEMIANAVKEQKALQDEMFAKAMEEHAAAQELQEQMIAKAVKEQRANQEQILAQAMEAQKVQRELQQQMIAKAVQEQKANQERVFAQAMEEQRINRELQEQMIAKAVEEQKAIQEQTLANAYKEYTNAMSAAQSLYSQNPYASSLQQTGFAGNDGSFDSLRKYFGGLSFDD